LHPSIAETLLAEAELPQSREVLRPRELLHGRRVERRLPQLEPGDVPQQTVPGARADLLRLEVPDAQRLDPGPVFGPLLDEPSGRAAFLRRHGNVKHSVAAVHDVRETPER